MNGINIKLLIVAMTIINPDSDSPVLSSLLAIFLRHKFYNTHMPLSLESMSLLSLYPHKSMYISLF